MEQQSSQLFREVRGSREQAAWGRWEEEREKSASRVQCRSICRWGINPNPENKLTSLEPDSKFHRAE